MKSCLKRRIIPVLLCVVMMAFAGHAFVPASALPADELRGVWVATLLNLDYPSAQNLTAAQMREQAIMILDNTKAMGMNAVFFQVRPASDALYPSDIFPWSRYISGSQGRAPSEDFDALRFWIDEAHKRGIELHAWINPFRVTATAGLTINNLAEKNPAKQHPEWTFTKNDLIYYNPGLPETRKLVIDGVQEILQKYPEIDGIHYDDYFYPGDIPDAVAYAKYGSGFSNVDDFRRHSIDTLIKDTYALIKNTNPEIAFGVSPAGIWQNQSSSPLGSNTNGNQSYAASHADTRKWVKEEYVDYIAPQIYWYIGHPSADYDTLVRWWNDVAAGTNVKVYVGHAAYQVNANSQTAAWRSPSQIISQLDLSRSLPNIHGNIQFRYGTIMATPALASALTSYFEAEAPVPREGMLRITFPQDKSTVSQSTVDVKGMADPLVPLMVNGKAVAVSDDGYFETTAALTPGVNTIVATQSGVSVSSTVTYAASAENIPNFAEISPVRDQYLLSGTTTALSVTAPIGATVSAKIGGTVVKFTPETYTLPAKDGKVYTTTHTATVRMPTYQGDTKTRSFGKPVYTVTYNGKTYSQTAGATLYVIMQGSAVQYTVVANSAWTYPGASSTGGNKNELTKGMTGYIQKTVGNWVHLSSGDYVYYDNVTLADQSIRTVNYITDFVYKNDGRVDLLTFSGTAPSAATATYSGSTLTYVLYNSILRVPTLNLPSNSPFSSVSFQQQEDSVVVTFTLKQGSSLDGYYCTQSGFSQTLQVKPKAVFSDGSLTGAVILIDPGHGGTDAGASATLNGKNVYEKNLNLQHALKIRDSLVAKGATVYMTRSTDVTVSLEERLEMSRNLMPDLFISVHENSMKAGNSGVYGVVSLYREKTGEGFAQLLYDRYAADLSRKKTGIRAENLYVCRGYWCPSVLLECGFMSNSAELAWLSSADTSTAIGNVVANSVSQYFS